jgi:hypothetical protein
VSAYWMNLTDMDGKPIEVNIFRYCEMQRHGNETRLFTGNISADAYCTRVQESPETILDKMPRDWKTWRAPRNSEKF